MNSYWSRTHSWPPNLSRTVRNCLWRRHLDASQPDPQARGQPAERWRTREPAPTYERGHLEAPNETIGAS